MATSVGAALAVWRTVCVAATHLHTCSYGARGETGTSARMHGLWLCNRYVCKIEPGRRLCLKAPEYDYWGLKNDTRLSSCKRTNARNVSYCKVMQTWPQLPQLQDAKQLLTNNDGLGANVATSVGAALAVWRTVCVAATHLHAYSRSAPGRRGTRSRMHRLWLWLCKSDNRKVGPGRRFCLKVPESDNPNYQIAVL